MATMNDHMKEDPLHFYLQNSLISNLDENLDEETLSPEDLAWADSCLNRDVDASDSDWSSIKDALLEILSSQQEQPPVNSSVAQSSMQLSTDQIPHSSENLTIKEFGGGSDQDEDFIDDDFVDVDSIDISEDEGDGLILKKKRGQGRGRILGNVFRPNYCEFIEVESLDSDLNMSSTMYEGDTSQQDIFKVWDLGVSDEQDDFTKQLSKALDDVPPQVPLNANVSVASKDLLQISIEDLVAGIGDLSLNQYTL